MWASSCPISTGRVLPDLESRPGSAILEDEQGEAARQLFDDAQAMLKQLVDERWFNPKAVIGFWPANTVGDDIRLFTGESRNERLRLPRPAPAALEARRQAQCLPVRFRRAAESGKPDGSAPSW